MPIPMQRDAQSDLGDRALLLLTIDLNGDWFGRLVRIEINFPYASYFETKSARIKTANKCFDRHAAAFVRNTTTALSEDQYITVISPVSWQAG